MKLVIISTAPFIFKDEKCFAYGPYVKELVIWEKYATEISFCCPVWENQNGLLVEEIKFDIKKHFKLINFNLNNFSNIAKAFFYALLNSLIVFKAMYQADHIHLRCPGNIGLLGCFVQILFPNKSKTAKYAGNWDPKAKQPWSYKLQKYILSNTFLTRNMQVLVYGEWKGSTKNIKSFFTATYSESEKQDIKPLTYSSEPIQFVFVGSLVSGKNSLYAIQLIKTLIIKGHTVRLNLYGEGIERNTLENYIKINKLEDFIVLHGNKSQEVIKKAYQDSHFVILPSKSEGWPKAIAEGMFWGCVPIASKVSCVPFMLDYGNRGILLAMNLTVDIEHIEKILNTEIDYNTMRELASKWSRNFTTDVFEVEIQKLLQP